MSLYTDSVIKSIKDKSSGLRGIVTRTETEVIKVLIRETLDMDVTLKDENILKYYLSLDRRFTVTEADVLAAIHSTYKAIRDKNVRVKDTQP
jgi:hypothetical protein